MHKQMHMHMHMHMMRVLHGTFLAGARKLPAPAHGVVSRTSYVPIREHALILAPWTPPATAQEAQVHYMMEFLKGRDYALLALAYRQVQQ
jgi:hypothetical protein